MVLISRIPVTAISSVRGIGVADMANTSTAVRSRLSCSLCSTPNRCSSSMMTSPRSLNLRSEEHTSELQSRQYLVCRLLLEKKKKIYYNHHSLDVSCICAAL